MPRAPPSIQAPISAQFPSTHFVVGGGVAIFHVASARVVVCRAVSRRHEEYFFLPKGRRDAGEESGPGAEREGYEEVRHSASAAPIPQNPGTIGAGVVSWRAVCICISWR
jgi:8-oxo-dGTP pyrophosphatase MutT (NUDIX family)